MKRYALIEPAFPIALTPKVVEAIEKSGWSLVQVLFIGHMETINSSSVIHTATPKTKAIQPMYTVLICKDCIDGEELTLPKISI